MFFTFRSKSSKSSVCFTFIAHLNQCSMATWSGSWALEFSSTGSRLHSQGLGKPLLSPVQGPRGTRKQLFEGHMGGTLT